MLVLSRKVGQAVEIDHGIKVRVVAILDNVVRLGFEAPPEVRIVRAELVERSNEEERDG